VSVTQRIFVASALIADEISRFAPMNEGATAIWRPVTVRSVVQFWISTFLNSANNAENISVLISPGKKKAARNLTPVILGTITVLAVWTIYFFAETVANTGQEKVAGLLEIISVKNVEKNAKRIACLLQAGAMPLARYCDGKGS
jgi:hypothetical protein